MWGLHQNVVVHGYAKIETPGSLTIDKNALGLVLQIISYLEEFESNTTSNWLNHTV